MNNISNSEALHIGSKAFQKNRLEITIDMCIPGMMTAEAIFNTRGVIIIRENTILDLSIIKTLKRLGVEKLKVFDNSRDSNLESAAQVFQQKYMNDLAITTEVIQDLYSGKPIDIIKVNTIVDSIIDKTIESDKILKNMNYSNQLSVYEYTHCINVSILSMIIARWFNYSDNEIKMIVRSGLLHDIGKTKVEKSILNKPGSLDKYEFEEARRHVDYGIEIIENVSDISYDEGMGILKHHEREDGSGYVYGLKGTDIHEFAKIIAVADVFDAMSSNRVYSKSVPVFDIFDQMETNIIGNLDKRIVNNFLQYVPTYYTGEKFFLNNGELAEIIHINPSRVAKPLVRIGDSYIDLSKDDNLKIVYKV